MIKRWLVMLASVIMLCALGLPVSAEDVTDFDYVISTVERADGEKIAAGEEFAIEISLTAVERLAMVEYHFRYDKTLMEPVSSTTEGFLAGCVMMSSNIAPARNDAESDAYGEIWITGMADSDRAVTEGEVISTIVFKALKDITEDSPMVGYYADGCDMAMNDYVCGMVNGGVVIGELDTTEIPEEMTAPINNPTKYGGTNAQGGTIVQGTDNAQGNSAQVSSTTTLVLILVIMTAVVVGSVVAVLMMKRKKR